MIITTNDLNNIETKIITPQTEGVEFINAILDQNAYMTGINASFNDIIAIIESEKLPIIACNGKYKGFMFIQRIYSIEDSHYVISLINDSNLEAENATTNMTVPR